MMPVEFLYHATSEEKLPSIMEHGLLTGFYGDVHECMDIHPPVPCIYLSREEASNNLNTALFERGPVVVLKIDASKLHSEHMWPDDCIYDMFADEAVLRTPREIAKALGVGPAEARMIFRQLEATQDADLPEALKPFWKWYLTSLEGGEVAYSADIPPAAILDVQPHPTSQAPSTVKPR